MLRANTPQVSAIGGGSPQVVQAAVSMAVEQMPIPVEQPTLLSVPAVTYRPATGGPP